MALAYYHKFLRYDEFTLKCVDASLKYYPMNPNAIITKGKSLDALLQRHLEQNGHLRDEYTDEIDAQSKQCLQDLRATHWTQETEALRSKWKQSPEYIERIRKNVQIIK